MRRTIEALAPYAGKGVPIVGLEPSCLLTFRDELQSVIPSERSRKVAGQAVLFEEFIAAEAEKGRFKVEFTPTDREAVLHGHCHQKAFAAMGPVEKVLSLVPGLKVRPVESSCCGMAGSFGYKAKTLSVSKAMAELSLLPAVREAKSDAIIAADGFSCRHQIRDGSGREAVHVARILASAIKADSQTSA
jgi:Fe-S oxidoreductase